MHQQSVSSTMNTFDPTQHVNPLIAFLQANKQAFAASPDLFQRVIKYISTLVPQQEEAPKKVLLPQAHGFMLIDESDIIYLEADGSYTLVMLTSGKRILVSRALKDFLNILSEDYFERIHKSHIINLRYLKSFSRLQGGCVMMENGTELLISRRRLSCFMEKMSRITLSFRK